MEKGRCTPVRDAEKTVGAMAGRATTVYLSYIDSHGYPTTRAMLPPREREGIRVFWFSTNTSSQKAAAFRANPRGSVYFVDRRFFRGVSLSGTVEVLEDPAAKERLWRRGDRMYYPQGVTDPDYCVLKFTAERGRYYSHFKSEDFTIPD